MLSHMENNKQHISVRLDGDVLAWMRRIAKRDRVSLSVVIRKVLLAAFKSQRKR